MKTEMAMLPNGNYEQIISPTQHKCTSKDGLWKCVSYSWDKRFMLKICEGDPYEGGYENETEVAFCPFCGEKSQVP